MANAQFPVTITVQVPYGKNGNGIRDVITDALNAYYGIGTAQALPGEEVSSRIDPTIYYSWTILNGQNSIMTVTTTIDPNSN